MNHPRNAEYMRARKKPNSYVQPSVFDMLAGERRERRQTVDWSQQVCPSEGPWRVPCEWNAQGRKKDEGLMQKAKAAVIFAVESTREGRVVRSFERRVPDGR
jgi:hypothetical protein